MVYTISLHAQKRMDERDITRPMVMGAIASGDQCLNENGCIEYRIDELVAVVEPNSLVIITVFFTGGNAKGIWRAKKKQRENNKEVKPTYIKGRGKINIKQQEQYRRMVRGL